MTPDELLWKDKCNMIYVYKMYFVAEQHINALILHLNEKIVKKCSLR